jgi:glycosyltransferase involved in cell wall biosynthesis
MCANDRLRLLVLTVMPSPYQRELFDAMAAHPGLDVRVRYYTADAPDRQWDRPELPAHSRIMRGFAVHSIARCCCFNPGILDEIRETPFDLAVVGDYFTLTAQVAMRYLTWRGVPWVLWGEAPGIHARGPVGRWLRRRAQGPVRHHAAGVAAIGTRAVKAYRELVGPGVPVFNIPYHCDHSRYLAIRRPRRSTGTGTGVRFLFSGQLIPRKGVDVLLRAFERICRSDPAATLTLLGDGPHQARYRQMISPEWRERVRFAGFRQPDELPDAFAEADVFVLPSRYDGWGVVVNEALAAAMPVVTTSSVGAAADLIEPGRNGMVVPPGDVDALADALMQFVVKPRLVDQFGNRSREMSRDWTVERGADRWYALARAIVALRNAECGMRNGRRALGCGEPSAIRNPQSAVCGDSACVVRT